MSEPDIRENPREFNNKKDVMYEMEREIILWDVYNHPNIDSTKYEDLMNEVRQFKADVCELLNQTKRETLGSMKRNFHYFYRLCDLLELPYFSNYEKIYWQVMGIIKTSDSRLRLLNQK